MRALIHVAVSVVLTNSTLKDSVYKIRTYHWTSELLQQKVHLILF